MWSHVSSEIPSIDWGYSSRRCSREYQPDPCATAQPRPERRLVSCLPCQPRSIRRARPIPAIPAAAAFNWSSCRLQMTTSAPAVANARAIAAPRPLLPPVTNAIRPERSNSLFCIIHPRVEPRFRSAFGLPHLRFHHSRHPCRSKSMVLDSTMFAAGQLHGGAFGSLWQRVYSRTLRIWLGARGVEASWLLLFRARLHLHGRLVVPSTKNTIRARRQTAPCS